jgi:hypothetical protein
LSRTIWLNLVAGLTGVLMQTLPAANLPPGMAGWLIVGLAVLNFLLRFDTTQAIVK